MEDTEQEPVLIITTQDDYIVEVGKPDCFSSKQLSKYIQKGYSAKTVTLKEYRGMKNLWIYEKK